jgi:hypothetical protein
MEVIIIPIVNKCLGLTSPSVGRITCQKSDDPVPADQPTLPENDAARPSVLQGQRLDDVDASSSHPQPSPPVVKDSKKLWKSFAKATNEGKVVQILAEILSDEDGGEFISDLERTDAELCIEILTNVSFNPHPHSSFVVSNTSLRPLRGTSSNLLKGKLSFSHCGGSQESTRNCRNLWF